MGTIIEPLRDVRIVGLDLDQTLYKKSPEIDRAIQEYIYWVIAKFRGCSLENAERLFGLFYPAHSGRRTLIMLGMPHERAAATVQEALENADLMPFLEPDPAVRLLLEDLDYAFEGLDLITGSYAHLALEKLCALEIPPKTFGLIISGEVQKSTGAAFEQWMRVRGERHDGLLPHHYLYAGDRRSTDVDVPARYGIRSALVNVTEQDPALAVPQLSSVLELRALLLGGDVRSVY